MIDKIWRGEIGLAWAFWGVGLLGLYPLVALAIGTAIVGKFVGALKVFPLPLRFYGIGQFGSTSSILIVGAVIGFVCLMFPSVCIWRSANRTTSNLWRRIAKFYVVLAVSISTLGPPSLFLGMFMFYMAAILTPEHNTNTQAQIQSAPTYFTKRTGLPFPKGANVAHVTYIRHPVMDYEFDKHIIINASNIDLNSWIETAKPFGNKLSRQLPEPGIEWNTEGLNCENRVAWELCELVNNPDEVFHAKHRIDLDNVVTLTVLEIDKLIWLHETQW